MALERWASDRAKRWVLPISLIVVAGIAVVGFPLPVRAADTLVLPKIHLTFNTVDVSGSTVFDVSGNGNNGTSQVAASSQAAPLVGNATAAPTLVPGVFGQAISFNGTTQYVRANGDAPGITAAGQGTLAGWYQEGAGESNAIPFGNDQLRLENDIPMRGYANVNSTWEYGQGADPAAGVWHHYAVTWNSTPGEVQLYIDGVQQGTTTNPTGTTSTFASADHSLYVGTYTGGGTWYTNGLVDEVFMFDVALTQSQIQNLMIWNQTAAIITLTPEPAAWAMFGSVALVMAGWQFRRHRRLNSLSR